MGDDVETTIGIGHVLEPSPAPPTELPKAIEFRNVTKTYDAGKPNAYTAIQDVTFAVDDLPGKGEFVCVLGPSGCGKSTILRLLAGLGPQHPPTSGEVLVFGEKVTGPSSDRGMVFQDYTSFDNRTVLDNIAFGLECRGVTRNDRYEQARAFMEKVGLNVDKHQYKYPHQLSGGMRQRVAIARTLILHPRLIMMDEPFGALDPNTRMKMQDLLISLWHEIETTVIFITHSIEEAVYIGDRVYIFSSAPGRLVKELAIDPPTKDAVRTQREAAFQETVYYIRDTITKLEHGQPID